MARARRGDTLSVTIDDLAFGGEGVGRADGYVVFVPGGVPGDVVRVRLIQARARFGRGVIEAVERPSPDRVEPPCPYFFRCGGCRLQHLDYGAQLAFKTKQVTDCLERLGGVGAFEMRPILPAPEIYGYRNKMEFTVARGGDAERVVPKGRRLTRTDGEAEPAVVVGLHEADRYDAVLDVERCLLQSDRMNALLDEARRFFAERRLTVYDQESGEGLLRFLMLREGKRTGEAMVNVVTSAPAVSELEPLVGRAQARVPETSSVVLNVNPKKASVAVGVEEHLLGGPRPYPRVAGRSHLPGVRGLVLPDQHRPGRAALRPGPGRRRADRRGDGDRPLLGHGGDQPAPRPALPPRLRDRGGAGGGRRRRAERRGQRHHQLHLRGGRGAVRPARADQPRSRAPTSPCATRRARASIPRRSPPSSPSRPRASCTCRATRPPSPATWATSREAGIGWSGRSRSTCSPTRHTSRSWRTSSDEGVSDPPAVAIDPRPPRGLGGGVPDPAPDR